MGGWVSTYATNQGFDLELIRQVLINVIGGEPGAVTIVVPFQLATIDGTLEAGGTVPGTLDGKPVTATKLLLKVANVTTEIYFDAATKKLLRMYTPGQDAEIIRVGFELTGAGAPPCRTPENEFIDIPGNLLYL